MRAVFFFLLLIALLPAETNSVYPLYYNSQVQVISQLKTWKFSPQNLCQVIKTENPEMKPTTCREEGSLARNADFEVYLKWLEKNLHPKALREDLSTRSDTVKGLLKEREFVYLLLLYEIDQQLVSVLFTQGKYAPTQIHRIPMTSVTNPESAIAETYFTGIPLRLPSSEERAMAVKEPDEYYSKDILYDSYLGLGVTYIVGFGEANPHGVYKYANNNGKDSTSVWNWWHSNTPQWHISYGWGYGGMFYGGLQFSYAQFEVDYDETHIGIKEWYYDRYQFGIEAYLGSSFFPADHHDLFPFFYLSFQYVILTETFEQSPKLRAAEDRFTIPNMKGATFGLGLRYLYDGKWGIEITGGLSNMSTVSEDSFNKEAREEIGGSSNELYLGAKIIWNTRFVE